LRFEVHRFVARGFTDKAKQEPLFYAFDLLNWEGKAVLGLPLLQRKRLLAEVLRKGPATLRFTAFLEGVPEAIVPEIRCLNLEGIVAKRADSRYEPGKRSGAWVKWKCGF